MIQKLSNVAKLTKVILVLAIVCTALGNWPVSVPTPITFKVEVAKAATINATCSTASINTAIGQAASGDTVLVSAGSCTISSPIALPANKDLTIQGATIVNCTGTPGTSGYSCTSDNATTLTCNNGCFAINLTASHRVTGFTMTGGSGPRMLCGDGRQNPSKHFRVDHNRLVSTAGWAPIRCVGDDDGVAPQGIWDHNRVENVAILASGTDWQLDDGAPGNRAQHIIWAKQPVWGGSTEVVYFEANHIVSSATNTTDGNYGCRKVDRFNTFADPGIWTFEIHGMQGENRGCQQNEIYGNYVGGSGGGFSEMRGGTGMYFNNTTTSGVGNINLTIDRSENDESAGNFGTVRECGSGGPDGNSPAGVDQQTAGQNGWRCRDQIGISHDVVQWAHEPSFTAWNQVTRPVYFWNNIRAGGALGIDVNNQGDIENKIVVNREFYCDAGFSGCNNGVRSGTLAAIPGTCTTGQGYWATDQADWNSLNPGNDGQLYRCLSANSWSLDYTPQAFPHPWTTGGTPTPPPPPPPPPTSFTLTISKAGTGTGTVTGTGINCGSDCSESIASGTSVGLTASATGGSTFAGWSGGGCSGTGSCNVTVTAITTVTATFNASSDTTPPTVSISAPSAGATVSGATLITANVSDNVGVAGVQFIVDGANLGSEDTSSPYSISWDTTTASNANHSLTAVARDISNNTTTSSAVSVTVNNVVVPPPPPPAGCTVTATGADRTAVNTAITNATAGSTVCVPAGTASWTSAIALPSNKDLTIQGATIVNCTGTPGTSGYACTATNNTSLTCNNGCFSVNLAANHRVTGFTMTNNGNELISSAGGQNAAKHFRIDHNRLVTTGGWSPIRFNSGNSTHAQGIWDHNRLEGGIAIHTTGTLCQLDETCGADQNTIWAENTPLGDSSKIVYVEGNHFVTSSQNTNFADGNYSARSVIRFNKVEGPTITGFEYHSVQGDNRGYQRWETYNNHFLNIDAADGCYFGMALIRGGTGVWFNNGMSGSIAGCNNGFTLDNVRSADDDPIPVSGVCNGNSNWDQNTSGQQGWHCRDQIGIGRDLSLWDNSPVGAWNQELKPAYIWGNTRSGSIITATVEGMDRNPLHIQANRDYYDHSTATGSSQTVGVRVGTLANRSTSCTTGVGYWATDQGEWNSDVSGADGQLYKCTSTNTWTLYYIPQAFPHPWTVGGAVTPPPPPPPPSFDFSMSNGGSRTVIQGSNVTNTITSTLTSGTTSSVSLSASGLPSGVSASFSPTSCSPTCTSTLTLTATAVANLGTTTITITGTGSGVTRTTTFSLTVNSNGVNTTPVGSFDEIRLSDGVIRGWSYDPDAASTSNTIHIYINGPAGGGGTLLNGAATNILRTDVNSSFGITGNHGVEYIIPSQYRDGVSHAVYLYGIDTSNSSISTLLSGSPRSFTLTSSDTTPPSGVTVTAPTSGSTVSGSSVTVSATASDNVGVAGVQFLLDGANLGSEDTSSPYSITWNTTTASNASHAITARARDAAGNQTTSSGVTVTVNNASGTFVIGARVIVIQAPIAVRSAAGGTNLGSHNLNELGTIIGGPVSLNGFTWWQIDYDTGIDGWSTQEGYLAISGGTPPPPPPPSFDFTMSNGGNKSVAQGSNVTNSVTATLTSGSASTVSFSASGLPSGVSASFSPTSCSATCSSTLTLTATGSATAGNSTITVTGTAGSTVRTTTFTLTVNDGVAPTVSLTAPANNATVLGTTTTVSATASDNVGVVGVQFKLDGVNLNTEDTSSPYSIVWNTTTATNAPHVITAVARDAAGNTTTSAGRTVTVNNPTSDTTAPSVPTNLVATPVSSSRINLSWTASTDSVGVTGYRIFRNGSEINTSATNSYADTGLIASTAYTYNVSAYDLAGNNSAQTASVVGTTQAPAFDFTVSNGGPKSVAQGSSVPQTITVTLASGNTTAVTFTASGLPNGGSIVFSPTSCSPNCSTTATITTTAATPRNTSTITITGTAGTTVRTTTFTLTVTDGVAPTVSLTAPANNATVSGATTTVTATATDSVGVVGVQFKLDGVNLNAEDTSSPYSIVWNTTTATNAPHVITAVARDAAGNTTTSAGRTVTVNNIVAPPTDTTAPSVPTGLTATATSSSQINLSWTASTDNTAVTGYKVFRNGVQVATNITLLSYSDTGLSPSTSYGYTVSAFDAANNNSAQSSSSSTSTQAPLDIIPPAVTITAPVDNATVSEAISINVTASDNVGVVGVQFKRDGLNLGAEVTSAPYLFSWDTTAATNGIHTLTAVARDAAGNSTTSASISVTVNNTVVISTDTTPPSLPTQVSASSSSSSQINLTWTASTDNIGVAGYKVYRNGTQVATAITATSYSDQGLSSSTTYAYSVQAYDAANNISALTASVNATTQAPPAPGGGDSGGGGNPPPPPPPGSTVPVRPDMYPPGCIFKYANNPTVYILGANNVANPITSWSVYLNQVPATRSIITIPDSITFTIGPVLGLRSGTLIKSSDNPTVYLVVSGQRQAFSSEQQFHDHDYNFSNVYSIDDINLVNSMPITTAEFVRPIGTLFKYAGAPAVYFLNSARLKRGYTSIQMFNIWNATLKDVVTIPNTETYPDGPIATLPDGIAVKGSGPTIYFTFNGVLRPFNDATLLTAMGMTLAEVKTFPDADISRQSIGSPMQ